MLCETTCNIGEEVYYRGKNGHKRKGVVVSNRDGIYTIKGNNETIEVKDTKDTIPLPKFPAYRVECDPMDAEWLQEVNKRWWGPANHVLPANVDPWIFEIRDKLLTIGGQAAAMSRNDPDDKKLYARGVWFPGDIAKSVHGTPCECHSNSCRYFEKHSDAMICTGYALSQDGMWRAHSWCLEVLKSGKRRIIETTLPRVAYFGFVMTRDEAEMFCEMN